MMKRFHLYWLRESGCDLGTPLDADELDATIRARVLELAGGDDRTLDLYLPFLMPASRSATPRLCAP
jgi:hypothetical protein